MLGGILFDLLALDPGTIHLWYVPTNDAKAPELLSRFPDIMSSDEHQRYQRFVFEKDRDQFLIARVLVRTTLSRYASVAPDTWRFHTNEFGKPEIDSRQNPLQLRFNLSHCDGLALCGVTVGRDIGVDCENIRRKVEMKQVASRVFSTSERKFLDSMPASQQAETFFRLWTLKEAYIKAKGVGISLPLQEIAFDISVQPVRVTFHHGIVDQPEAWQFVQPAIPGPYLAAIAINLPRDKKVNVELHPA